MRGVLRNSLRSYRILSPGEYLINQHESINSRAIKETKLRPLERANQSYRSSDELVIYSIPRGEDVVNIQDYKVLERGLTRVHPDLVFLQMSPENFLVRQRFLSHKSALNDVEDFDKKAIECLNPEKPETWEELVVNLVS